MIVMNCFSKWVDVYALPNQEAFTVPKVLIKRWLGVSEYDCNFTMINVRTSKFLLFTGMWHTLGIRKMKTIGLHLQTDGKCSRWIRLQTSICQKGVSEHQRDWVQYIHFYILPITIHRLLDRYLLVFISGRTYDYPGPFNLDVSRMKMWQKRITHLLPEEMDVSHP